MLSSIFASFVIFCEIWFFWPLHFFAILAFFRGYSVSCWEHSRAYNA